MARIFLVGCSGHASVVADIVRKEGLNLVAGVIDSFVPAGTDVLGVSVLGAESDLPRLMAVHNVHAGIVAIGDNFTRHSMVEKIRSKCPDFTFVQAIHPSAQIGMNVRIGEGTVVMAGVIINPNSTIGEHCIVNTSSSVDHDNTLERFSSLAPGVVTGGNVRLGEFSALSLGAAVIHGCSIGPHTIVGAGATVLKDIPAFAVAYGTPARVVRARAAGEYL